MCHGWSGQHVTAATAAIPKVDTDPRAARYLLTGSARGLGLRSLPDTLPGRTETIELWPLSQGEIGGTGDGFVDTAFSAGGDLHHTSTADRDEYARRVVRGGFPEAVARSNTRRRQRFFDAYTADLITRDVSQLSEIERTSEMRARAFVASGVAANLLGADPRPWYGRMAGSARSWRASSSWSSPAS